MQLGSDIDEAQVKFFREAAAQMKLGDRVILCTAEPHWIFAEAYRETDPQYYSEKNLSFLESDIFADRIQIFLAGDLHHYRRHEADDGRQKITSGGGGAFLHPTHEKSFAVLEQDLLTDGATQHTTYRKKACYPDEKTSFRLCFRNLLFPFLNPKFGVVPALMYLLFAWSAYHELKEPGLHAAISSTVNHLLHSPFSTMLSLAIILAFIFFTDTHFRWYKWIGGGLHALLHLLTALLIGWGASLLVTQQLKLTYDQTPYMLVTGLFVFAGGWIVGSFIFGIYLLLSMNLFRRHSEEAFSGLRIEDYKNFLRMRLDPDGSVTIFPIGIEKVAKRWKPGSDNGPAYEPDGPFTEPFLIEKPIHVGRVNAARGAL